VRAPANVHLVTHVHYRSCDKTAVTPLDLQYAKPTANANLIALSVTEP